MSFRIWGGQWLAVAVLLLIAMPLAADDYDDFRSFAEVAFRSDSDALIRDHLGAALLPADHDWQYLSERSASLAFSTNLPARSRVEYGIADFSQQTPITDRAYYRHLHHLQGLEPGTQYRYRVLLQDEQGGWQQGPEQTLSTPVMSDAIRIPADIGGEPPYTLDTPSATYLLTEDITSDGKAFELAAEGITLDLGGHTVTYNAEHQAISGDWPNYVSDAAFGVRMMDYRDNIRLLNGRIRQGAGNNAAHEGASIGFNPIYGRTGSGLEIAGLDIEYAGAQMIGMYLHYGSADAHLHHNVITDRGSSILNRHGSGSRAILISGGGDQAEVHGNLIRRTRQGGLQGNQVYGNEIYIDSYSTNSFGIGRGDEASIYDNRIFGTGYHVVGIAWGRANHYHNNVIHMVGQGPNHRASEYGNQESLNGLRLTQYGGSTADYSDNTYEQNLILIQGGQCIDGSCTEARGIQHSSDANVVNNVIRDNVIKVDMAEEITQAASVVTQGLRDRCGTEDPVRWQGNTLISNITNVRMGDYYAAGCRHHFYDNTLVRVGQRSDYYTFQFDVHWDVEDHRMIDTQFSGGAGFDSLRFRSDGQALHIGWSLALSVTDHGQPLVGAEVSIYAMDDTLLEQTLTDSQGQMHAVVPERIRRSNGDEWLTPTRIVVEHDGLSVEHSLEMQKPEQLTIDFSASLGMIFRDRFE